MMPLRRGAEEKAFFTYLPGNIFRKKATSLSAPSTPLSAPELSSENKNVSLCLSVSCGGKRLDFIVQSPYP